MTLLRVLGTAYQHLAQFNCSQAIEIFSVLPAQHYNTGWVLSMLAKAHFEMIDYKKAARYAACSPTFANSSCLSTFPILRNHSCSFS